MQCCLDLLGPTLHKKIICAMVGSQSTNKFAQENNLQFCMAGTTNIAQRNYLCIIGPWLTDNFYEEMFCQQCSVSYAGTTLHRNIVWSMLSTGLQKSRSQVCTYRAPKTSIRYTKKRAPIINIDACFTKIL